jgi:hypothetical protein
MILNRSAGRGSEHGIDRGIPGTATATTRQRFVDDIILSATQSLEAWPGRGVLT